MPKNKNLLHLWRSQQAGLRGDILEGASRSGKTWAGIDFLLWLAASYPRSKFIIVRETYNSFKTTLYDDFNRRLPQAGFPSPFEQSMEVSSFRLFDSKVMLMGADTPTKYHGAGSDFFWINEALDVPQAVFDQLEMRCRGFWWMDYNPKYTEHWIYDKVCKRSDVGFCHSVPADNPLISPQELQKIMSYDPQNPVNIQNGTADDYNWKVYGLGLRGAHKTGQEYYYAFSYARHVLPVQYKPGIPLHISFDQNVVPYITMTLYQVEEIHAIYHVSVLGEYCLANPQNTTEALCRHLIKEREPQLRDGLFYYGDATGRKRDTRGRENDYDIVERVLRQYLNNRSCRVPFSNPLHSRKREFINKVFNNRYPIRLTIDPSCKKLLADLEQIQEDPEGKKWKPKVRDDQGASYEKLGHASDTLDYFLMGAFKRFTEIV